MSVIIGANEAQVTINYTGSYFASGGGATVLGFRFASGPGDLLLLAGDVAAALVPTISSVMANTITISTVTAVNALERAEVGLGVTGSVDADTCVPNSAVLTSYSTARRGPRGRGRSYWPGMAFESSTNGLGVMTGPQTTALQDAIDAFFAEITEDSPTDTQQVILQGTSDDPSRPDVTPPITPAPLVLNRVVQSKLATQRRRLRS